MQDGKPFAGSSMTEDYEVGLRIGALGLKTMFVRIPARPGRAAAWSPAAAISRRRSAPRSARRRAGSAASRLPAGTGSAGAAGSASAGCGCATGAGRSPPCCCSPPMSPRCCGRRCGSPKRSARRSRRGSIRRLTLLLTINAWLLAWRILMRACFTALGLRLARRPAVDPAAGRRQRHRDARRGPRGLAASRRRRQALGQDPPHLPGRAAAMRPSLRFLGAGGGRLGRASRGDARRASGRRDLPDRARRSQDAAAARSPTAIPADRAASQPRCQSTPRRRSRQAACAYARHGYRPIAPFRSIAPALLSRVDYRSGAPRRLAGVLPH